ncbi:phage major capsid protein [Microbacterium sp. XT11]|uniref:phage major capsid protein n=1 Tax=Microbacterium sp. XT11 TaxID=367477 RepID=UPI000835A3C9|nr:hypothetical protein [Microbacterium sp. XT11]
MPNLIIESGVLLASEDDRTAGGLLVPFNEKCRSNLGEFIVEPGALTLPRHPSGAVFTDEHDRVVGEAVLLAEEADGIHATFRIDETPEGDAALAAIRSGKRRHLSVEAAHMVIQGGKAVAGRLFGGSLVERPAFPSAVLLAAEGDQIETQEKEPTETKEETTETFTDEQGVEHVRKSTRVTRVQGDTTTITETIEITEPEPPAEGDTDMPNATVPGTLLAGQHNQNQTSEPVTKAAFAKIVSTAMRQPEQAHTLLAALNDVKISGTGAVGTAAVAPDYIGEIWSGQPFARKVIPLLQHGDLTSLRTIGWRWVVKPEVAEWAGNKAAVPSNTPTTEPDEWTIQRFAGGWDIAREFVDFGETEVIESFLTAAAGSYARKSDDWTLAQLLAAATATAVTDVPTGIPAALAGIVDGALAVIANDARPSYALVNPADYRPLLFTQKNDTLEYLSMALGLDEGSLDGFKIVPHTGITAGSVLVGAREAAAIHELPGSPIRVNALDMVKGGIDEALFGYVQFRGYYAEGIQLVSLTPAGAGA